MSERAKFINGSLKPWIPGVVFAYRERILSLSILEPGPEFDWGAAAFETDPAETWLKKSCSSLDALAGAAETGAGRGAEMKSAKISSLASVGVGEVWLGGLGDEISLRFPEELGLGTELATEFSSIFFSGALDVGALPPSTLKSALKGFVGATHSLAMYFLCSYFPRMKVSNAESFCGRLKPSGRLASYTARPVQNVKISLRSVSLE